MCNSKVSSSPKDTFPKAQHLCFLSMHYIVLFMNVNYTFVLKCGVLLEVLKQKISKSHIGCESVCIIFYKNGGLTYYRWE